MFLSDGLDIRTRVTDRHFLNKHQIKMAVFQIVIELDSLAVLQGESRRLKLWLKYVIYKQKLYFTIEHWMMKNKKEGHNTLAKFPNWLCFSISQYKFLSMQWTKGSTKMHCILPYIPVLLTTHFIIEKCETKFSMKK